jgi:hypothetical protein
LLVPYKRLVAVVKDKGGVLHLHQASVGAFGTNAKLQDVVDLNGNSKV